MIEYVLPVSFALGLWWFSTGVVLYLDNLPGRTFRWTMFGGIVVLALAIFGHIVSSTCEGIFCAYASFTCGVIIWGVLEMSYFTGFLAGPRRTACPQLCRGWKRFWLAVLTSLYHELAIIATAALMILGSWEEANQSGTWTFIVLWLMRWSAKLNLFLGVPNINEEWLPEDLRYLRSYMPKRGMNLLFPFSITIATVVVVLIVLNAIAFAEDSATSVRLILVATLLGLGILEHWFLVLPLPDEALWAWALPKRPSSHKDDSSSGPGAGIMPRCATPAPAGGSSLAQVFLHADR